MQWRPVVGFPGYEVSDQGVVRSLKSGAPRVMRAAPGPSHGYRFLGLTHEGKLHGRLVHRLVAEAFLGPQPSPTHQVNHIDGDKLNNTLENLEWVTSAENNRHARRHGLAPRNTATRLRGSDHHQATLTEEAVIDIRRRVGRRDALLNDLAIEYGVSRRTIADAANGRTWQHVPMTNAAQPKVRGEQHHRARLDAISVRDIRNRASTTLTADLAREFGVSTSTITRVIRRQSWRHVA